MHEILKARGFGGGALRLVALRWHSVSALFLTALISAVSIDTASAAWQANGWHFAGTAANGTFFIPIPDGAGGWYVGWRDSRDEVRIQRITPVGEVSPGWPVDGVLVAGQPYHEGLNHLSSDGQGGTFLVWRDDRLGANLYSQRIMADGSIAPGWPADGSPVCLAPQTQEPARVAPDGLGGAYFAWDDGRGFPAISRRVFAQHLTASGSVAPGWLQDGLALTDFFSGIQNSLIPDGRGGFFAAWLDLRSGGPDTYGLRVLPDGSLGPGWNANGNLLALGRGVRDIVPDGAGGFYVTSFNLKPGSGVDEDEYWVGRWTSDGVPAAGWSANGIRFRAGPGYPAWLGSIADSTGGIIASWYESGNTGSDIYAVRVLPDGSLASGWNPNGTVVSSTSLTSEYDQALTPDGMGGAYFTWIDETTGIPLSYVQHIGPHGTAAPGWPAGGMPVANTLIQEHPQISTDGQGGALVVWEEQQPASRRWLWAQYYVPTGIVATQLALATSEIRSDHVTLVWQGTHAGDLSARVERREDRGDWRQVGLATRDGADRLRYEDRDVLPAARYAYRLAWIEDGAQQFTIETWIDVPGAAALALRGLRPNPAVDAINVSLSLSTSAPATLELVDLAGRLVANRDVGSLGMGPHLVRLDDGASVAPGMYWLRLRQGGQQLMARAVVMR